jgi:hypothetical protein
MDHEPMVLKAQRALPPPQVCLAASQLNRQISLAPCSIDLTVRFSPSGVARDWPMVRADRVFAVVGWLWDFTNIRFRDQASNGRRALVLTALAILFPAPGRPGRNRRQTRPGDTAKATHRNLAPMGLTH